MDGSSGIVSHQACRAAAEAIHICGTIGFREIYGVSRRRGCVRIFLSGIRNQWTVINRIVDAVAVGIRWRSFDREGERAFHLLILDIETIIAFEHRCQIDAAYIAVIQFERQGDAAIFAYNQRSYIVAGSILSSVSASFDCEIVDVDSEEPGIQPLPEVSVESVICPLR